MEHKIGELFKNEHGLWYQCIPSDTHISDDCYGCCFLSLNCCICNKTLIGKCDSEDRKDGKSVIFKKLEKVGEPYYNSDKKLCQQYKCYTEPLTADEIVYVFADKRAVIEVKQNKKEDMEEKKTNFVEAIDALCKRYHMSDGVRTDFMSELKEIIKDKEKCNLKPFDLEASKAGNPVCTRGGRKARIICFDAKGDKPIIALVEMGTDEIPNNYPIDGKDVSAKEGSYDLMMLSEKKEGWVNVYSNCLGGPYESKEKALKQKMKDCIDTVKISWEE